MAKRACAFAKCGDILRSASAGQKTLTTPKTATSARTLLLPDALIKALRQHQERQALEREALGEEWQDQGLWRQGSGAMMVPQGVWLHGWLHGHKETRNLVRDSAS